MGEQDVVNLMDYSVAGQDVGGHDGAWLEVGTAGGSDLAGCRVWDKSTAQRNVSFRKVQCTVMQPKPISAQRLTVCRGHKPSRKGLVKGIADFFGQELDGGDDVKPDENLDQVGVGEKVLLVGAILLERGQSKRNKIEM